MAGLLYFSELEDRQSDADLKTLFGFSEESGIERVNANKGPGGSPGVVGFNSFPASLLGSEGRPLLGFYPDRQTWVKVDSGAFWIGWETSSPPKPSDFMRAEKIDGHSVKLADGNEWLIPIARIFPQGTKLPQGLILGPGGEWIKEGLLRFAAISECADRAWAACVGAGEDIPEGSDIIFTEKDQIETAIQALGVNYAIGKWEVSALKLFTTGNTIEIVHALIDIPTLQSLIKYQEAAAKKKDLADTLDGSNSDGGKQGAPLHTSQPSPTPTGSRSERD